MTDHTHDLDPNAAGTLTPPAQPSPVIPWGWLRAIIFFVVFLVATVIESIIIAVVTKVTTAEEFMALVDKPIMVILEIMQMAVVLLLVWLFRRFIDRRSVKSIGFGWSRWAKIDLVAGFLWGIGLVTTVFLIQWMLGWVRVVGVSYPFGSLFIMAVVIALAAAREEIVMRGYMLKNVMESANKYLALVFISVLFALSHGLNPNVSLTGIANIIIAGLLLGVYYVHRQNLWFPIGLHIGWNYFQGAVWGSPVSGIGLPSILKLEFVGPELWTGGSFGFEASLLATIVTALATILIHFRYRNNAATAAPSEERLPEV
ncbi:CPBP family intramembrane metalloprotease [bacterium]|nr:CPBP family intramembrane metalloprotease [bacterium]